MHEVTIRVLMNDDGNVETLLACGADVPPHALGFMFGALVRRATSARDRAADHLLTSIGLDARNEFLRGAAEGEAKAMNVAASHLQMMEHD